MKILFVFTGGTISTTLTGNVMKVDDGKPYALIKAYEDEHGIDFDYDCVSPYLELSENNTGEHLDKLCSCVKKHINNGYDGIVVTHGTDTLQYSAAALGYVLGNSCIPVCIVSASYPLEHPETNALDNLHGAILLIKNKLGKGVFVPFRSTQDKSADKINVHRATNLLPSVPFSDEVMSVKNRVYGWFTREKSDKDFYFIKNYYTEKEDCAEPFEPRFSKSSPVLFLHAHVGMTYPELSQNIKYVLISSYHSGTIDTKSDEAREFYLRARERRIKVFVAGVSRGDVYESANEFSNLYIIPLELSPISAYVKLWLIANSNEYADRVFQALGGDSI